MKIVKLRYLLITPALLFTACSTAGGIPPPTEYIALPSYCTIEMPEKPTLYGGEDNFVENFKATLIYKDQLEMRLHCCRGDAECILPKK